MNLVFAAAIGVIFGAGVHLLLQADLLRVVTGLALVANAASLTLMSSGLTRGREPILPLTGDAEPASDPVVQALTLTAIVIGFATTALLLALIVVLYRRRHSVDLDDLSREEAEAAARDEAEEPALDAWRELGLEVDEPEVAR
ncbi:MAG: NADH-quinone oxidoreductase subunit K [Solirubrobacteraceae bacterium]|nr:NADH-quinone oxidoreductase subunit K [Solirubrobacteraceae bacterium]